MEDGRHGKSKRAMRDPAFFGLPYRTYSVDEAALECTESDDPFRIFRDSPLRTKEPPFVLAPMPLDVCDTADIDGTVVFDAAMLPTNRLPMEFMVALRQSGALVDFRQGGDPMENAKLRTQVVEAICPHFVVKLNESRGDYPYDRDASHYYGSACEHIFYVPDFSPSCIRNYSTQSPGDQIETVIFALAAVAMRLFRDLMTAITAHSGRLPPDSVLVVYLHCQLGLERSRTFFLLLHAFLYIHSCKGSGRSMAEVVLDWCGRQSMFPTRSLAELLTVKSPGMFTALAHMLAINVDLDIDDIDKSLHSLQPTLVEGSKYFYHFKRPLMPRPIMRCRARDLCRHLEDVPKFYCVGCENALFCNAECFAASGHADKYGGGCHARFGDPALHAFRSRWSRRLPPK